LSGPIYLLEDIWIGAEK